MTTRTESVNDHLQRPRTKAIAVTHLIHNHGTVWPTRAQMLRFSWEELDSMHQLDHLDDEAQR